MHPELGDFLFRAMDDTYIFVANLLNLTERLRLIYDVDRELVFRGFLNSEYLPDIYLGGGVGWLQSRQMVAVHKNREYGFERNIWKYGGLQDDSAETAIIQKIFQRNETWAELAMIENCANCNGEAWQRGEFKGLPSCPSNEIIPLNDIVSLHTRGCMVESVSAAALIGFYPHVVYIYHQNHTQRSIICKSGPGLRNPRTSLPYMTAMAEHVTLDDLNISWSEVKD
jgi:hypothetical protein